MDSKPVNRPLVFERLECKAAPSAALLADASPVALPVAEYWQAEYDVGELLQFVHSQTREPAADLAWQTPSADDCRQADEMMALRDADLRALVLAELLVPSEQEFSA